MIALRIATDEDQRQRITLPGITMEEHRFRTPAHLARVAPVPASRQGRVVAHGGGHGVEHVLDLLLEHVSVDHGAVGGLFDGEITPAAGVVERSGRFVFLVMVVVVVVWKYWWWWEEDR